MKTLIKTEYGVNYPVSGITGIFPTLKEAKKYIQEEAEGNFDEDHACCNDVEHTCSGLENCDCNCECGDAERIKSYANKLSIIKIETFKDEDGEETTEETEI